MSEFLVRIIFHIFILLFERLVEIIFGAMKKAAVGWGRTIIAAFHESTSQGLLCLFVPPYAISHATELKRQRTEVESVVTEFMEAGAAKDVEAAFACWSPQSLTKEGITELIERSYKIFSGYERLAISSQNPKSSGGIDSYHVKGDIIYTGDQRWPFEVWLVKDNYVWKIAGIQTGSTVVSTTKRWNSKKMRIVAISVGVLAAVVLVPSLIHMFQFFSGVETAVAEFIEAGAVGNMEAACACWSPQSATEEEIAGFVESNYDVFTGYERLSINNKNGQSSEGINSCYISGAIIYTRGQRLPLEASLMKENDIWKMTGIRIGSTETGVVKII